MLVSSDGRINGRGKVEPKDTLMVCLVLRVCMRLPALMTDREQRILWQCTIRSKYFDCWSSLPGKTIMAIHRVRCLKLGKEPILIMYNRVLNRYTNSGQKDTGVKTLTMLEIIGVKIAIIRKYRSKKGRGRR